LAHGGIRGKKAALTRSFSKLCHSIVSAGKARKKKGPG